MLNKGKAQGGIRDFRLRLQRNCADSCQDKCFKCRSPGGGVSHRVKVPSKLCGEPPQIANKRCYGVWQGFTKEVRNLVAGFSTP